MLPGILKKSDSRFKNDAVWLSYLEKIGDLSEYIDHDFLSSICLEHYDRFNSNFPKFDIFSHKVERAKFTAEKIYNEIRYNDNKFLNFWYFQVDAYLSGQSRLSYPELEYCMENKRWSFCPVIISTEFGLELGASGLGNPYHLIEGTHRISFINRLLELGHVAPESLHELLIIMP